MIDIVSRWNASVLYHSDTAETIKGAVIEALKSRANLSDADLSGEDLSRADLSRANLSRANLSDADLSDANLSGANLIGADLSRADLSRADLSGANLSGANLIGADLSRADLIGANLIGADLSDANLSRARLSDARLIRARLSDETVMMYGETWRTYISEVVPALLTGGGKAIAMVATKAHWDCHNWNNCPMAAAFSCEDESGTPLLLRPRVREFVQLFDARLIKLEDVLPK